MPKAVPIVVSAGLAVGVFCGLLFGVGKKSAVAAAPAKTEEKAPAKSSNAKAETPAPTPAAEPTPEPAAAGSAGCCRRSTDADAGSRLCCSSDADGSCCSVDVLAAAEHKTTKIVVVIKTEAAAKDAKLIVDGKPVDGLSAEIPTDNKTAKVEVKSSGFRSYEKKLDLTPGELTLEIEMAKRPASTGAPAGGVKPPKKDKPPAGGGGLIDI